MRLVEAILFAGNLSFETVEKAHHESCYLEKDEASMAMANLLGVTFDDLASFHGTKRVIYIRFH